MDADEIKGCLSVGGTVLLIVFVVWLAVAFFRQSDDCTQRGGILVKGYDGKSVTGYVCVESKRP